MLGSSSSSETSLSVWPTRGTTRTICPPRSSVLGLVASISDRALLTAAARDASAGLLRLDDEIARARGRAHDRMLGCR